MDLTAALIAGLAAGLVIAMQVGAVSLLVVETAASPGSYARVRALRVVVDGRPAECSVVRYATEPIFAGRASERVAERETVTISLPLVVLAQIGTAREVRGLLGGTDFRLTPQQLSAFRAFRRRLEG